MTERKPPGVSFESWVERQIREAAERGAFDNLPGAGKPLPGLRDRYEEQWWLKGYLRREGLPVEAVLPTPLRLRKEIERLPDTVRPLRSERQVREVAAELDQRIAAWLRSGSGPQVRVGRVDPEQMVERWRADRQAAAGRTDASGPAGAAAADHPRSRRPRWWRRRASR